MSNRIAQQAEAVLFFSAEPVPVSELAAILGIDHAEAVRALDVLADSLADRGIRLIRHNDTATLVTAPDTSAIIETMRRESLNRNLGKASLETLAIILYRGPVTRAYIDYIRGVNSTFTLRSLLIRGLIERVANPGDQRSYLYRASADLIGYLGITAASELPEFAEMQQEIAAFETTSNASESDTETAV